MENLRARLVAAAWTSAIGLAIVACSPEGDSVGPSVRNVLVISSDDHAAYAMGAYGNDAIRTPNLDRLASQGVRFDRAYVNCPSARRPASR